MKRSPIKSRSQSPRRRLEAEADALWQEAMKAMWRGRCMWKPCKNEGAAGHHLRSRKFKETRHQLLNGVLLCNECHTNHHNGNGDLAGYIEKHWPAIHEFQETIKAIPPRRVTCDDLRDTIEDLRQFIQRMEQVHVR